MKSSKGSWAVRTDVANRWRKGGREYVSPGSDKDDRKKHFSGKADADDKKDSKG